MILADPSENLEVQNQSGTGKTFIMIMLSRVDPNYQLSQCLCLTSIFELAMKNFFVNMQVTYAVRVNRLPRETLVKEPLAIGTPGTLLDWRCKLQLLDWGKSQSICVEESRCPD
ncbi:hypothetical protein JRQ81_014535 [Phrynocephalus forsythii]|uniref:Uncharacterized protein n=1 Tax=Phrynocephalus forsythii TaxID=171643 RepID=A0A9Q1B3L6_9SAUR|nr:hypothetical protein JRQ81_014535 [Phrynocephalus forsythii]